MKNLENAPTLTYKDAHKDYLQTFEALETISEVKSLIYTIYVYQVQFFKEA